MAEVKWIKLMTNMFDNRKIRQIECLPEGDWLIVIWVKLLCLAGTVNDGGMVYFTKEMPYTEEMLAQFFNRPLNLVKLALHTFEQFGMIEVIDNIINVSNWERYQNVASMDKIREDTRKRVSKYREKQKLLEAANVTRNVTVTLRNATEEEEERRKKKEEEDIKDPTPSSICPYQKIIDSFNSICVSYPKVISININRKKAIKARWVEYGNDLDVFTRLFAAAEASSFLKGKNSRNWAANFDWLMKAPNMAKVLEGNYDDKQPKQNSPGAADWHELDDVF